MNRQHFKRSPEVQEAVKRFELLAGYQVIKAKRYEGSMRGYVHFVIEAQWDDVKKVIDDLDLDFWHYQLGNCKITYRQSHEYWKGHEHTLGIDVAWEDLGMDPLTAYLPKFRGHI